MIVGIADGLRPFWSSNPFFGAFAQSTEICFYYCYTYYRHYFIFSTCVFPSDDKKPVSRCAKADGEAKTGCVQLTGGATECYCEGPLCNDPKKGMYK